VEVYGKERVFINESVDFIIKNDPNLNFDKIQILSMINFNERIILFN
jgi:hypothetical protein